MSSKFSPTVQWVWIYSVLDLQSIIELKDTIEVKDLITKYGEYLKSWTAILHYEGFIDFSQANLKP